MQTYEYEENGVPRRLCHDDKYTWDETLEDGQWVRSPLRSTADPVAAANDFVNIKGIIESRQRP